MSAIIPLSWSKRNTASGKRRREFAKVDPVSGMDADTSGDSAPHRIRFQVRRVLPGVSIAVQSYGEPGNDFPLCCDRALNGGSLVCEEAIFQVNDEKSRDNTEYSRVIHGENHSLCLALSVD